MKRIIIILIHSCLIIPVFLFAQMESITISNQVFKSRSRSSVQFNHGNHMMIEGVSCTDCHHRFENGKNVLDTSELTSENKSIFCSSCHMNESSLKNSYHRLCIGCHQSMTKSLINKNKTAAPRLCGECHK